jgi:transcriptional regulator with XRE-family HTH domain
MFHTSRSGLMDADRFRECLAALDWSQHSIARLLGVNFATVQRWATGKQEIPPDIATWLETLARCHEANPRPERSW